MRNILWRETENRYGTPTDRAVPAFGIAYGGLGPRLWGRVEGGKVYLGREDA